MTAKPKRVCVVGAGAAGMSCVYALSLHPDKFHVTVYDKAQVCGGMATSIPLPRPDQFGASFINDGVQGCAPTFANTLKMFDMLGFKCQEVEMQISFGKEGDFWSNVFPSQLTREYEADIKKFGRALKMIQRLEVIFAFIPVHTMLRMFRFSQGFGEKMVYPLVALFFGTGNQTPYISSAILERVFMDSSMRLFEFNEKSLLANIPTMYGFPKLHDVYKAWQDKCTANGSVAFKLGHEVLHVLERKNKEDGVVIQYSAEGPGLDGTPEKANYDEIILACDADAALRILGKSATWKERQVLGSVKYLNDVTVTHNDLEYMQKYYETLFNQSLAAEPRGEDDEEAISMGKNKFRPLYYTMQYPQDRNKIEMSFDLTHYQPQFRSESSGGQEPSLPNHVFQTIFLDQDGSDQLWTWNEIKEEKRIAEKWWKQQSHRWQHYAKVVPWMMFINGKNRTHYAGAWTVLNMHEIAVTSGFAAAYRLGAAFPFKGNDECERLFRLYLTLSHGVRMRKEDRKGFFS